MPKITIYNALGEPVRTVIGAVQDSYPIAAGCFHLATVVCEDGGVITKCYVKPERAPSGQMSQLHPSSF